MSQESNSIIPVDILDDLCCRFIESAPDEDRNKERMHVHIQKALWHFEDFYVKQRNLKSLKIKEFTLQLLNHCPDLRNILENEDLDVLTKQWAKYVSEVSSYGGILLNEDMTKCLLIRANKSNKWGFPKGKINKNEKEIDCAIREIYEEVGFDVTPYIKEDLYFEETYPKTQRKIRLYIICGIPESTRFETKTRGEIDDIKWFKINRLHYKMMSGLAAQNTLEKLIKWVAKNKYTKDPLLDFKFNMNRISACFSKGKECVQI